MGIEAEYQRALWSRLDNAKASMNVLSVHDFAPQVKDGGSDLPFPYLTMGSIFAVQADTQTSNGFEITHRVHTFSRSGSMLECKVIQGQIYDLLHKSVLNVTGFNNYELLRVDTDCFPDDNSKIHGVCEYRALVQSTA